MDIEFAVQWLVLAQQRRASLADRTMPATSRCCSRPSRPALLPAPAWAWRRPMPTASCARPAPRAWTRPAQTEIAELGALCTVRRGWRFNGGRSSAGDRLWSAVGLLLVLPALLVGTGPGLARQGAHLGRRWPGPSPGAAGAPPGVHSAWMHLGANLAGALLLLLLGPCRAAAAREGGAGLGAGLAADPSGAAGQPALLRYGGLSRRAACRRGGGGGGAVGPTRAAARRARAGRRTSVWVWC